MITSHNSWKGSKAEVQEIPYKVRIGEREAGEGNRIEVKF